MGYRKRRDDADDVDKRLAEGCDTLPSSAAAFEHRGQQQGAQEEYVINAGPDVPDAGLKKVEKLAPERDRMRFELPGFVVRAENRRVGAALLLQPKQAAVLQIDIEEKRVFDAQNSRGHQAISGEPHDLVSAVAVAVDQMFRDCNWAADSIGGNYQSGQCVSGDYRVLGLYLRPGDLSVTVGIEPNGVIEIAKRDIPLSGQVIVVHRKREVAVAWLVGVSRRSPHRQQQNQKENPHRSACSAVFC